MDSRSRLAIKYDVALRLADMYLFQHIPNKIVVNEYPKCGGTWLAQLIAEVLKIDFPRNKAPNLFNMHLLHEHRLNVPTRLKPVHIVRDGRDVMISAYYHYLFVNDRNVPFFVEANRKFLAFSDYEDIRANLPKFIEFLFEHHAQRLGGFSWADFVMARVSDGSFVVKYEDLKQNTSETLARCLDYLDRSVPQANLDRAVAKFDFNKQKAQSSEGKGFLRSGRVGEWKDVFSHEATTVFDRYGAAALTALNY